MKKILSNIIPLLVLIGLFLAFNYASYRKGFKKGEKNAVETIIVQRDTIYQFDTITRYKPKYVTSTVVDSIPYPVVVHDTDTLWAQLPRTVREYGDSTFYAQVSGVEPSLDRIDVYRKTQYINNTVYVPTKDTRKDYIELDARLMWDKQFIAPVTLNIGHKFGPLDMSAGAGYDFLTRTPVGQIDAKLQFKF